MEGLKHGLVVVKLSKGCVELHEEHVVDARVPNIMTNRRDQQGQTFKRTEKLRNRRFIVRMWWRRRSDRIGRQNADLYDEVEQ